MSVLFDNTDFSLGDVKYGTKKETIVHITNTYDKRVALEITNSSCSCTYGSLKKKELLGGEVTELLVSIDTVKAGGGANQVKIIYLRYVVDGVTFSQNIRFKLNII